MVVLIPAYEPDERLVELLASLTATGHPVVVVDDGSGPRFAPIFAAAMRTGADVLTHEVNRGKGRALKTGFAHIATTYPGSDVVCADCDGQHRLADIVAVAQRVQHPASPPRIVLGSRTWHADVPWKSKLGNNVTRRLFRLLTGRDLTDTQTGLRAYPAALLPWLQTVHGERFEYEMEMLLAAGRDGIATEEHPIDTVYIEGNASTHFHPVIDSIRVYVPFVRFMCASLASFVVDTVVLLTMMAMTDRLAVSVVTARVVSAAFNFAVNHLFVFDRQRRAGAAAVRYAGLVVALLACNYTLMRVLTGPLGLPLLLSKVVTEVTLFLASYGVQRRIVFARSNQTLTLADPVSSTPSPTLRKP